MYFIFYDSVNAASLTHTRFRGEFARTGVSAGKPNKNIRRDKIRRQHKESTEKVGKNIRLRYIMENTFRNCTKQLRVTMSVNSTIKMTELAKHRWTYITEFQNHERRRLQ